jgi:hypothetical protein
MMWVSENPENDVDLCACVVHDTKDEEYYVFLTTDISKTAKQIITTYELRTEIERDFRQIKDYKASYKANGTKTPLAFFIL